jgi:hypothetical protein
MKSSPYRAVLRSLPAVLALVLVQSGSLFAQEPSLAALAPAFSEPKPAGPVETASIEFVPSAPGSDALLADMPTVSTSAAMEPMAFVPMTVPTKAPAPHPFWDRKNRALFSTVAGLAALDFYATHANLASGGKELNPVTRVLSGSTPGLATNFALEAGSVIGLSYVFHKTGHHKLERITALVNIGASGAAAGYSLAHR